MDKDTFWGDNDEQIFEDRHFTYFKEALELVDIFFEDEVLVVILLP